LLSFDVKVSRVCDTSQTVAVDLLPASSAFLSEEAEYQAANEEETGFHSVSVSFQTLLIASPEVCILSLMVL
jgi:hypothetical protein